MPDTFQQKLAVDIISDNWITGDQINWLIYAHA